MAIEMRRTATVRDFAVLFLVSETVLLAFFCVSGSCVSSNVFLFSVPGFSSCFGFCFSFLLPFFALEEPWRGAEGGYGADVRFFAIAVESNGRRRVVLVLVWRRRRPRYWLT